MEHLFKSFELKAKGEDFGTIEGYFSTYEKTPDSYGDIITDGAFSETLKKRAETGHPFPICFNHDFDKIIGVVDSIEEKEKGPYMTGHFLDTDLAQDVRKFVKSGAVYQFSFAYDVLESREPTVDEKANGVINVLTKLDLFEVSVVTVPANQNAVITEVKMDVAGETFKTSLVTETPETKSGRRNRKADEEIIKSCIASLQSLLDGGEDIEGSQTVDEGEKGASEVNEDTSSKELKDGVNLTESASKLLEKINNMKGDS